MTEANKIQVGGQHYKGTVLEHWDLTALFELDYFQGQITKYVMRWKLKNGIEDLKKAQHFLQKYIELEELRTKDPTMFKRALVAFALELPNMV